MLIISRYFPQITQIFLICSSLLISFLFPLLFGLKNFGIFSAETAYTFIIHRLLDLIVEPLIAEKKIGYLIFSTMVIMFLGVSGTYGISYIFSINFIIFNPLLFMCLAFSSLIVNILFMINNQKLLVLYAILFTVTIFLISIVCFSFGMSNISYILIAINILGISFGIMLLSFGGAVSVSALRRPARVNLDFSFLKNIFYRLMFASFVITITFGIILFATDRLPPAQIGSLRLFATFALLGAWVSPVNPKAFFSIADEISTRDGFESFFVRYRPAFMIALGGWLAVIVSMRVFQSELAHFSYLGALLTYPCVLFSAAFDKVLLWQVGLKRLGPMIAVYSTALCAACYLSADLVTFEHVIQIALIVYPLVMALALSRHFAGIAALPTGLAFCGFAVLNTPSTLVIMIALAGMLAILGVLWRVGHARESA